MSIVSDIPRKHARSLQRRPSLAFDFGHIPGACVAPSIPPGGTEPPLLAHCVGLALEFLLAQKTKLPRLMTVCLGKPDTMLSRFVWIQSMPIASDSIENRSPSLATPCVTIAVTME